MSFKSVSLAVVAVVAVSCKADPIETGTSGELEGDDAGECADGADNDADGYFDCQDNDCWGSPDCNNTGQDTDTDADADADADTDVDTDTDTDADTDTPGAPYADHLTGFDLTYTLEWDIQGEFEDLAASFGIVDCVAVYTATSDNQTDAVGDYVTFWGQWKVEETGCGDLTNVVWFDEDAEEAYATFRFGGTIEELDDWIEHGNMEDNEPLENPSDNEQWYFTSMNADVDTVALTVHHEEDESTTIEGLIPITLYHTVDVQFRAE